ncbi:GDSL-type esterase/lipase family protein [Pseudozobellia thermophila]|uniref:GDSL-type esterase/lipase family protein n=1 Tax=Pseudozobellia thermophila TaxID=192903 RepID=UPI00147AE719|nr:GDSL-type esterase/lipase family protein [Pseudozobellia thermophila]
MKKIKVACVGNSITYGARVHNRTMNSYPAQLQNLLGNDYQVKNFGVSGTTLLKRGDRPYWETEAYKNALAFVPDIVFIKLGTNDSKSQNRVYLNEMKKDYEELIGSFKAKNQDTRIILLLPVPAFTQDSTSIYDPVIKQSIIPKIQEVAYTTESEVIDLYQLFVDRADLLPDKIHPSDLGAAVIAQRLYECLVRRPGDKDVDLGEDKRIEALSETNFYGYRLLQFKFKGHEAKLALPKRPAKGLPWVLRARFWGHEPQTDIALLERGFHIAYCDVSELFGNREAVGRWNSFHALMTGKGLSQKVVIEAMSRGGLIAYNWAAQNADKVACIYADAPVLTGKSWPGGKGTGTGSAKDWEKFKLAHGVTDDGGGEYFEGDPMAKIKKIAQGGYPILHVCGETDKVVPIVENTIPFAKGIEGNGGTIETIYKPENGHHPHSLPNPTPILNFILRATGQKINFATVPAPSAEYRSAAGWTNGKDWWAQAADIDSICAKGKKADLLLVGNSITQGFGGTRPHVTHRPGKEAADLYFSGYNWINAGISGDRTQNVLWRLLHGAYEKAGPKVVVLTVGVNNFPFESSNEIAQGIRRVVEVAERKFPDSRILLFGPLVTGIEPDSPQRKKYNEMQRAIDSLGEDPRVSYHEIAHLFLDGQGKLDARLFSSDGIHLKPEGYKVWAAYIKQQIGK